MKEIVISNIELLTEEERDVANKLLSEYYDKIKRQVKTDLVLEIHLKEYDKEGKKKKYSLNSKAIFSGKMISSSAWDWDFTRAIHKAMKKIETELEHKFRD